MFKVGDIVRFKQFEFGDYQFGVVIYVYDDSHYIVAPLLSYYDCILNSNIMTLCNDYFDYLKGE